MEKENKVMLETIKYLKKYIQRKDEMIDYLINSGDTDINDKLIDLYDKRTRAEVMVLEIRNEIIKLKLKK